MTRAGLWTPLAIALAVSCLGLASAWGTECKDDPEIVDRCFMTHGRVSRGPNGKVLLSPVGADPRVGRIFNVRYPYWSPHPERRWPWAWVPPELQSLIEQEDFWEPLSVVEIYGEFEVCRLTVDEPGYMGLVCIQTAKIRAIRRQN
jgi:hypothetical protein